MNIYDKFGFDKEGYNKDGFDRMGYNREGYDRDGYDKNGVNKLGINKLTGYDCDGYDRDGYDEEGYNREGYDREGYDKRGFDIDGYNLEGYNREGYDKNGYDIKGYNAAGYDREGYDKNGYDINGYDREGYNIEGLDENGFDVEGYDAYGFDRNGINKNGYDINGKSEDGINILGYDEDGFDVNGKSIEGFSKELFDEDGYHIYTGFNLKGFDRDGYNINGIDIEGYNRDGFHYQTGYNREGYDCDGYDKNGYDRFGYDKEGYDRNGYDINGYDINGSLDQNKLIEDSNDKKDKQEDLMEISFFKKCEERIKGSYKEQVTKEIMQYYVPKKRTYIDKWGLVQSYIVEPDMERANREIDNKIKLVLKNPYQVHVDYSSNPELYIGNQKIPGWITDWADDQAQIYYQYKIYIGNKDIGLNLVRMVHFLDGKYSRYEDLYNKNANNDELVVADEYLKKIIKANQENKKVHDIVASIQQNQYDIISSNKEKSMLVLGCAGSGKTMILMHKIHYMEYNDKNLNMNDIMIISPTDILAGESRQLSRLLHVDRILQSTSSRFYLKLCVDMMEKIGVSYESFGVCDENIIENNYYQYDELELFKDAVYMDLENNDIGKKFLNRQANYNKIMLDKHIALTGCESTFITKMHNLYVDSIKEIEKAGKSDIERIIKRIRAVLQEYDFLMYLKEFITYLVDCHIFENNTGKKIYDRETTSKLFYETKKVLENLDYLEFSRAVNMRKGVIDDSVKMIQTIQLYLRCKLNITEIHKVLKEWEKIPREIAETYIKYVSEQIDRLEILQKKSEILKYLLENDMIQNRYQENEQIRFDTSFEKLVKLYEEMEIILDKIGMTPFEYFSIYEKITRRKRRLSEQKKQPFKKEYLFDTILTELNIEYSLDSEIKIPQSKLFAMTYILYAFSGAICSKKKYIFIDEFQDFSPNELLLIKSVFPKAVFNLFGDVKQCINSKGIRKVEDIPNQMYEEKPKSIDENYRNARQITEYVNSAMDMKMFPVGLDGIQKNVYEIPNIVIETDDRVAIIVGKITNDLKEMLHGYDVNYYEETGKIIRGIFNVIPIAFVKGLEFEKVIVIQHGMQKNEYYVACTRAIKELYILLEKSLNITNDENLDKDGNTTKINSDCTLNNKDSQNDIDLSDFQLIPYRGKLKKYTNIKNMPVIHIHIISGEKEKMIPVYYLEEIRCAYISEATYNKHKNEIDAFFK